jgi:cell wall-associated NlpC family hydrolase
MKRWKTALAGLLAAVGLMAALPTTAAAADEKIEKALEWGIEVAENDRHGYSQTNRFGPDYDCSSFVISAWQNAGVPVKDEGATYTGNMYYPFLRCGFKDVTLRVNLKTGAGLEKGDVLLNKANHTEMYVGGNQNVKASINEKGGTVKSSFASGLPTAASISFSLITPLEKGTLSLASLRKRSMALPPPPITKISLFPDGF